MTLTVYSVATEPPDQAPPGDELGDAGADDLGRAELEADDAEEVDGEVDPDGEDPGDRRLSVSASFRGPLPHPSVLQQYDDVVPGLAKDIVDQWKGETAHRHKTVDGLRETDREAMRAFYGSEKLGQILGFTGLVLTVGVAALAILLDYPIVGLAAIITAAGGATWALRRRSTGPPPEPVDLDDDEDVETLPAPVDRGREPGRTR